METVIESEPRHVQNFYFASTWLEKLCTLVFCFGYTKVKIKPATDKR